MGTISVQLMGPDISVFLSVLLGTSILSCILFNGRVIWLCAKKSKDGRPLLQLSPYLLSSGCAETVLSCVFGPILCMIITQNAWSIGGAACAFFDCLFLSLFWSSTASMFIYSMDRHCLLVQRRFYPETFGKLRRNAITMTLIWATSIVSALPYLGIRSTAESSHVPMTFFFRKYVSYSVLGIVILYLIPVFITVLSLIKTVYDVKFKRKEFHHDSAENGPIQISGRLKEDFQSCQGLAASSCVFIITSLPWVLFQLLKALELIENISVATEITLMITLVFGVGMKTATYVVCSSCTRERFCMNIFKKNANEFSLESSAVVLTNIAAL